MPKQTLFPWVPFFWTQSTGLSILVGVFVNASCIQSLHMPKMSFCPVHQGAGFCDHKVAPQQTAWVLSKPVDALYVFPTHPPAESRHWSWQWEDSTFPRFSKITCFSDCIRVTRGQPFSARSQPLCIGSDCKRHLKTILLFDLLTACSASSSVRRIATVPLTSTGLTNPRAKKPKSYQR